MSARSATLAALLCLAGVFAGVGSPAAQTAPETAAAEASFVPRIWSLGPIVTSGSGRRYSRRGMTITTGSGRAVTIGGRAGIGPRAQPAAGALSPLQGKGRLPDAR